MVSAKCNDCVAAFMCKILSRLIIIIRPCRMPNAHMCSWGTISSRNTSAPSRHHGRTEKTTKTKPYGYNKQMQSLLRSVTQTVIANTLTHVLTHTHTRTWKQYTRTHETHKHLVGTETTSEILCTFYSIYLQRNNMLARRSLVLCVLSKKYFQFGRNCCWS